MSETKSVSILKETWSEFSRHDCMTQAAALAYYTVFSLPAALLIVVKVAGSVLGEKAVTGQLQSQIAATMGQQVGVEIGTMVQKASASAGGGIIAVILGIVGLVWAASNITNQLQTALNRAWAVEPKDQGITIRLKKRFLSFLLIAGVGILVLIALAAGAAATAFSASLGVPDAVIHAGEIVVTFIVFTFLFGVIFKVLPDATVDWADVRMGGLITAALFVVGKFLVGLYIGHSGTASAYGVAGSLALLLLWTYYSSIILLLGAEFTQVLARHRGKEIEPDKNAVRVAGERQPKRAA